MSVASRELIDLDEYPDLGVLIDEILAADRERTGADGLAWIVQHGPILGGPYLSLGVNGQVAAVQWMRETPGSAEIPAHGTGSRWVDYYTPTGDLRTMAPGSQVSRCQAFAVLRDFAYHRGRPQGVEWRPEPELRSELLPSRAARVQLRHELVVPTPYDHADELIGELERWNADRPYTDRGFAWFFGFTSNEEAPNLWVGVRGEVGALVWWDDAGTKSLPDAGRSNADHVDYFAQGHHVVMPPGSEAPISVVYDALREFLATRKRPTCLGWVSAPDES